jgi:hypothetical protein
MDDARIRQLTEEVLAQIGGAPAGSSSPGLEARVAALEAAVARMQPPPVPPASSSAPHVQVHAAHPSLQALRLGPASSDRCVVEPDKPCVQSGQCRALGH